MLAGFAAAAFRRQPVQLPGLAGMVIFGATVVAWIGFVWRDRAPGGELEPIAATTLVAAHWVDVGLRVTFGVAAMMLPLALPATRHVVASTFRAQRTFAAAIFLATFVAIWAAFGLLSTVLVDWGVAPALTSQPNGPLLIALLVAAGWQFLPLKRIALRDCHLARPLPPRGWRSSAECLRFGTLIAARCVASCGGLMLPMFVAGSGHVVFGMLATAVAIGERRVKIIRRRPWLTSVGALAFAGLIAASGSDPGNAVLTWLCAIPRIR